MPRISENDAFALAQGIDTLDEVQKPKALEILTAYRDQQNDLGEPQWPSQAQEARAAKKRVTGMFTGGIDKVPFEVSPWSKDPAADKATVANMAFLAHRYGKPPQEIADRADFYRNDYARQFFGQPGGVDEKTFYGLAAKQIQTEQQQEGATLEGMKAALRGDDVIPALQAWQLKNGLDRMPDSTQFTTGFLNTRAKAGEHLEFADSLLKQIESNTGITKGDGAERPAPASQEMASQFEQSLAMLADMKPRDRKQVYAIIGAKAEAAGYDQKGFWSQMLSYAGKQMARFGDTTTTAASDLASAGAVAGDGIEGGAVAPDAMARFQSGMDTRGKRGVIYDEVADIAGGVVDPVKPVLSWMNDSVETGLIKAPGAIAPFMMASAALGPLGGGALFTADFAEQNRRDLVRSGLDDSDARLIGMAAAPIQAAVESLSNGLQLGRFPAVQKALSGLTKPIGGGAGIITRYGLNSLISLGSEYTEEQLQDNIIRPAIQNVVAAFDTDVPEIGVGQIWENIKKSSPELILTLAPMALVFGGKMTVAQANLSSAVVSSQDMLEAAGYSAAQANSVRAEATPEAQISKARELWGSRAGTPKTMEDAAKSVAERMRLLQTDHLAAQQDLEQRGILPRMLRATDDQWRLTFNDGSAADFNSHSEADAARWQWASDQLGKVHTAVQRTLGQMEKNAEVGREFALQFSPDERHATPDEMASKDFQDRVKQGELLDEVQPEQQYSDAVAIDKASGGDVVQKILGSSVNTFKDGVLTTTMKLYQGADITTLVEEKLEGDAKAIMADADGRQWMLEHMRNYEQASGDKLFAVENDAQVTDKMLAEAWSHLGQSYLVGKSTSPQVWPARTARRMFNYVLNAGLSPVMNAETQYWRAVAIRAQKVIELQKAGKLGNDLAATLEKQLGIDSQAKHEQGAAGEAITIGNEALSAQPIYSETNPGPNGETFSAKKFTLPSLAGAAESVRGMKQVGQSIDFPAIYAAAKVGQSSHMLSLDALYAQAKKKAPTLTTQAFGKQMQALYNNGSVLLEPGDLAESMRSALDKYGLRDSLGIPSMYAGPVSNETFSLSRAVPADASNVIVMPDGARLVGPTTFSIRAYHGTPHKVGKFSLDKIGTGEGAQAYGWGLYFAQSESVAKMYRDVVGQSPDEHFQSALNFIRSKTGKDPLEEYGFNDELDYINLADSIGWKPPQGNLYTVDLLPDEEDFLDWDKPLSEQSEKVKNILVGSGLWSPRNVDQKTGNPLHKGDFIYEVHGAAARPDELGTNGRAASEHLAELGIPGIRYLDGNSRSDGEGTYNYVIFDESLVKIIAENGKPVSSETFSIRPGDFSSRMAVAFSPFQRSPELRMQLGMVAKARAQKQAIKLTEIIAQKDAADAWKRTIDEQYSKDGAQLLRDYEDASDKLRKEREFELKGVTQDKGSELDRERIRREFDNKLKTLRVKYERDLNDLDAKKAAELAKNKNKTTGLERQTMLAMLRTLDGILSAAPPEVRAKVGGYVKLAGLATDEAMLKEIERRIEKLNVELEKWLKKEGVAQIEKLLKKGRPSTDSGKKAKGKDADLHYLFSVAEKASKMDSVAVAGELARLDSLIAGDTLTDEQETTATTERGLVELLGDLKNADSGRVFSAIDTLKSIYDGAWLKWKLAEIERKERRAGMRHAFITDTGKSGLLPERQAAEKEAVTLLGKIKGGFLSLSSFHEVLSYAFGSKSARVKSLVDAEREASGQYEDANQALADEVEKLFTDMAGGVLAGEKLRFDMAQPSIKTSKGDFSQLQAIQALLMWRQDDGRRHMEGQFDEAGKPIGKWNYDQAWINEITKAQTAEAKMLMSWIMQKYGAEWATLNPLYRERYGVNMPAHDNYAPITVTPAQTKAGEVVDPVTGSAMSSGSILTPGSLRTRSRNAVAEPEFRDALQTLLMHTRQLEYWKAYYDLAVEANAILGNREVLNAVKAKGGDQAASALRKWVDAIAQGGFRDASASLEINKMMGRMTGRAATVGLLGRVSTLSVQSTQLAAASVKMPLGAYLRGMSKLLTGNLSYADAIKSPFIQRRFKSAPPIVRQAMESLGSASKPNQIKRATRGLGQLLSGADALFTSGTYALLLDYHRSTGKDLGLSGAELEQHAHTEAERDTEQVAQPTRMAARSLMEITSTTPLAKVTWAYSSEARQKIALFAWSAFKAKSEPAEFAKTAFLVFGVGGLMTQVLKNLWKEAKGDDDEKKWSPNRLVMDMLGSPLHGIPFVGSLMNDGNMLSGFERLKHIDFQGDAVDIMRDVDTALSVMGLFNDTASGVAALSHLGLDAAKVLENLAGK